MRILLISDHADPLAEIGSKEAGGQNIYVDYLSRFLSQAGVKVDIYTRWDRRNKKEIIRINSNVRVVRVKAGPKRYIPRDSFLGVVDEFSRNVEKIILRENLKYDIIHTNYWFSGIIGLSLAKKIHLPVVHVFHSIGLVRHETLKSYKELAGNDIFFQKRIAWEKKIVQGATKIVSTSPVEKEIIKEIFKVESEKIKVIPIGIDDKIFYPIGRKKARKKIRLEEDGKIILYVGRIEWRKGIGTLLYAFRELLKKDSRIKLLVVGGGGSQAAKKLDDAECQRLKQIATELGIRGSVHFLGAKKQNGLRFYYSAADVTVVPSYYEPFGIVPVESMACGTPVVASQTGGLKFTVKNGLVGRLVPPRDHQRLAEALSAVLTEGKGKYESNCRQRVAELFLWEEVAKKYLDFFNQLLKKAE